MTDPNVQDWRLPPIPSGRPAPADVIERRRQIATLATLHREMPEVPRRAETIGGVPCIVVGEDGWGPDFLYFHGGGYRIGNAETWIPFACRIAIRGRIRVILADYRVAPEHPFPAAVHDAATVFAALAACGEAPFVGGDSAGGGLAAALTVAALARGRCVPAGLILISPWLDLTLRSPTYESHAEVDRLFSREAAREAADLYLQGHSPEHVLASPLLADLAGFPPVQIFSGGHEVLLGDATAFVDRLAKADRRVEAQILPSMPHVWPMIVPDQDESAELVTHLVRFVRSLV